MPAPADPPERRTLAREQTPNGEIALARRGDVEELIIDGVFAMDSLDRSSEDALADALGSPPGRVLVGGLGLGYTAARLLATGAAHVTVVELAAPLVAWANDGLTPTLATVTRDPRATIVTGDIAAALTGELPGTEGPFDAIALDVDNGPSFLIHQRNRALYDAPLLTAALNQLAPGGRLAIWCERPDDALAHTLAALGPTETITVPVRREQRSFAYAIYLTRRA